MSSNSVGNQVKAAAITSLTNVLGHGEIFSRVVAEIQRVNKSMPNATGSDKKARVIADAKIIFEDAVEPIFGSVINLLIELGVAYVSFKYPVVAPIAASLGTAAVADVNAQIAKDVTG